MLPDGSWNFAFFPSNQKRHPSFRTPIVEMTQINFMLEALLGNASRTSWSVLLWKNGIFSSLAVNSSSWLIKIFWPEIGNPMCYSLPETAANSGWEQMRTCQSLESAVCGDLCNVN